MKYSLRKSFSFGRRKEIRDDDHVNTRIDQNVCSNSNSNLVKNNQSKTFLRRRRRYSSSPPPSPSPNKTKSRTSEHPYNNHINDDDDDDDPFSSSGNTNTRVRPLDKLTNQIRKSFRNTLTRQRSRLESTNSNKRLILKTNDENRPVSSTDPSISTGLTSPIISVVETSISDEKIKIKTPQKRRKAPLAPTHINQSYDSFCFSIIILCFSLFVFRMSLPNPECLSLRVTDHQESGYVSSSNEPQQNLLTKKTKLNRSFRTRISLLLKKSHAKQQQMQNSIDEETEDELNSKKSTLSQRFDTIRRSFHLGNRNSTAKGKRYLLSNE
jgi:hypothetical protein